MRVSLGQPLTHAPAAEPTVTLPNGHTFRAIVMATAQDRADGMQWRGGLDPDQVMLFVFQEARQHTFHMDNVRVPLDVVWLDKMGKVTWMAGPGDFQGQERHVRAYCMYAVEAGAGWVKENGLGVGSRLILRLP
jgi:uncharacterized membrane protein (UPF0127 family)